jgi:hypothetical protein
MPAKRAPRTPFLLALLAKALVDRAVQGYCRDVPALRRAIGTTTLIRANARRAPTVAALLAQMPANIVRRALALLLPLPLVDYCRCVPALTGITMTQCKSIARAVQFSALLV